MFSFFQNPHKVALKKAEAGELPDWLADYVRANQHKDKNIDLERTQFVVFDTETTGLDPKKDSILSLAAVAVSHQKIKVQQSLECVVKGSYTGKKQAVVVHQILPDELTEGIEELDMLEQFVRFIGADVLVAHYAEFDIKMINALLKKHYDIELLNLRIDTIQVLQKIENININERKRNSLSLGAACERYDIQIIGQHTAMGDTFATAELFIKLLMLLRAKGTKKLSEIAV
ncbi:MAG: 3'-5' exonuclease [Bernardetiaceae bacterium]|nr:3'-5' exonuclease [Bernardetiaceae bacterium]